MNHEDETQKLLRKLGIGGGYLGFYYTATAIEILMDLNEPIYQYKWLYNEVAEKHQTTSFCVERNIRTLIEAIWNHGNRELLKEIIPYPNNEKPKNAQFIDGLAAYLAEHEEE